jgi:hypothetical protein
LARGEPDIEQTIEQNYQLSVYLEVPRPNAPWEKFDEAGSNLRFPSQTGQAWFG